MSLEAPTGVSPDQVTTMMVTGLKPGTTGVHCSYFSRMGQQTPDVQDFTVTVQGTPENISVVMTVNTHSIALNVGDSATIIPGCTVYNAGVNVTSQCSINPTYSYVSGNSKVAYLSSYNGSTASITGRNCGSTYVQVVGTFDINYGGTTVTRSTHENINISVSYPAPDPSPSYIAVPVPNTAGTQIYDGTVKAPWSYSNYYTIVTRDQYGQVIDHPIAAGIYTTTFSLRSDCMWDGVSAGAKFSKRVEYWMIQKATAVVELDVDSAVYKKSAVNTRARTFRIGGETTNTDYTRTVKYKVTKGTAYCKVTAAGKVTIKRAAPKGLYKVKVFSPETDNFKASKAKYVTIRVK